MMEEKDLQKSLEQQFLEAVESINNAIFDNGCENKSKHGDAMEVKIKHPDLVYIDHRIILHCQTMNMFVDIILLKGWHEIGKVWKYRKIR